MTTNINTNKILFLDIETVPISYKFNELSEKTQDLWDKKTKYQRQDISAEDYWKERGGILAEFGKIICISFGYFSDNKQGEFRVKSIYGDKEEDILKEFSNLLEKNFFQQICAHNGKEFDIPFICRRAIINNIKIPNLINFQGKKPWEVSNIILDTMDMWKFGDRKNFTSIDLLSEILKIPSPKNDLDGSKVAKCYYEEKNIEKIRKYCEDDVICVTNIFLRLNNLKYLDRKNIKLKF